MKGGVEYIIGYKESETKRCGNFDNEISLGIYICYDCIKDERSRNTFLSQYNKSKAKTG
jgi:hypothetical protein